MLLQSSQWHPCLSRQPGDCLVMFITRLFTSFILKLWPAFPGDTLASTCTGTVLTLLSLHFNGHFPGGPGLALPECLLSYTGAKGDVGGITNWSYKMCKAPVKMSPPANQHPTFYRPDAIPVTQPTASKHWREKYHIPSTCLPQTHPGSSNFVSDH